MRSASRDRGLCDQLVELYLASLRSSAPENRSTTSKVRAAAKPPFELADHRRMNRSVQLLGEPEPENIFEFFTGHSCVPLPCRASKKGVGGPPRGAGELRRMGMYLTWTIS